MFSHIMIGSNDIARSKRFYDALLGVVGVKAGVVDSRGRLIYLQDGARFLITKPINGEPATPANGGTLGFAVSGPEQAKVWHQAGLDNGGAAVEDAPGERQTPGGPIYLAYLRDPDGNKLCALHRMAG